MTSSPYWWTVSLRPALHLFNGSVRRTRPTDYEYIRTILPQDVSILRTLGQ